MFDKFCIADTTETKKYLEYYLKMWEGKNDEDRGMFAVTTRMLIDAVNQYNELLPYMLNKDIYSRDYNSFFNLKSAIRDATIEREDRLFDKRDHVYIIIENENYLLVSPKTHRGSLKYGANTKWCTASTNNEAIFKSYVSKGTLGYLISKRGPISDNYKKIAFYLDGENSISGKIQIFNTLDKQIGDKDLVLGGWSFDDVLSTIFYFRIFDSKLDQIKKAKLEVNQVIEMFNAFNPELLAKNLNILGQDADGNYLGYITETIENFTKSLKKFGIK